MRDNAKLAAVAFALASSASAQQNTSLPLGAMPPVFLDGLHFEVSRGCDCRPRVVRLLSAQGLNPKHSSTSMSDAGHALDLLERGQALADIERGKNVEQYQKAERGIRYGYEALNVLQLGSLFGFAEFEAQKGAQAGFEAKQAKVESMLGEITDRALDKFRASIASEADFNAYMSRHETEIVAADPQLERLFAKADATNKPKILALMFEISQRKAAARTQRATADLKADIGRLRDDLADGFIALANLRAEQRAIAKDVLEIKASQRSIANRLETVEDATILQLANDSNLSFERRIAFISANRTLSPAVREAYLKNLSVQRDLNERVPRVINEVQGFVKTASVLFGESNLTKEIGKMASGASTMMNAFMNFGSGNYFAGMSAMLSGFVGGSIDPVAARLDAIMEQLGRIFEALREIMKGQIAIMQGLQVLDGKVDHLLAGTKEMIDYLTMIHALQGDLAVLVTGLDNCERMDEERRIVEEGGANRYIDAQGRFASVAMRQNHFRAVSSAHPGAPGACLDALDRVFSGPRPRVLSLVQYGADADDPYRRRWVFNETRELHAIIAPSVDTSAKPPDIQAAMFAAMTTSLAVGDDARVRLKRALEQQQLRSGAPLSLGWTEDLLFPSPVVEYAGYLGWMHEYFFLSRDAGKKLGRWEEWLDGRRGQGQLEFTAIKESTVRRLENAWALLNTSVAQQSMLGGEYSFELLEQALNGQVAGSDAVSGIRDRFYRVLLSNDAFRLNWASYLVARRMTAVDAMPDPMVELGYRGAFATGQQKDLFAVLEPLPLGLTDRDLHFTPAKDKAAAQWEIAVKVPSGPIHALATAGMRLPLLKNGDTLMLGLPLPDEVIRPSGEPPILFRHDPNFERLLAARQRLEAAIDGYTAFDRLPEADRRVAVELWLRKPAAIQ